MKQDFDLINLRGLPGYFHQDWMDEFDNWEQAVEQFIEDNYDLPNNLKEVISSLDDLTNLGISEAEFDSFFNEYDWNYRPSAHGETHLSWLKKLLAYFEDRTGIKAQDIESQRIPPKTAPGIAENLSDDRLRRLRLRESIKRRARRALTRILVVAALWEFGYQCSKMVNGEANVSRFGGIMSMFRQLFGAAPHYPKTDKSSQFENMPQPAPHSTRPQFETNKTAKPLSRLSTAKLVAHHKLDGAGGEEEFVFEVNLYKKDQWFDTGIPVIVGNFIWAYPPDENPNAIISAKIAGNIKDFHIKNNEHPYPSLDLIIMSHEVEYENVVLRNDDVEHLFLKLKENPEGHIRLFVRLDLVNVNGALEETKQRQIALIEHSWKLAGHYAR